MKPWQAEPAKAVTSDFLHQPLSHIARIWCMCFNSDYSGNTFPLWKRILHLGCKVLSCLFCCKENNFQLKTKQNPSQLACFWNSFFPMNFVLFKGLTIIWTQEKNSPLCLHLAYLWASFCLFLVSRLACWSRWPPLGPGSKAVVWTLPFTLLCNVNFRGMVSTVYWNWD